MNNIQSCAEEIVKVWRSFESAWESVGSSWKDKDRDQFEREYFREFSDMTNAYIAGVRRLTETVQQILKEIP